MRYAIPALALAALAFAPFAQAAGEGKTAQQSKMAECNQKAGDTKGDERKAFMKECLSAKKSTTEEVKSEAKQMKEAAKSDMKDMKAAVDKKDAGDAKPTQQTRMKTCNAEAKGKTGDERKAFMKECLSGKT